MLYVRSIKDSKKSKSRFIMFDTNEKTRCTVEKKPEKIIKFLQGHTFNLISTEDSKPMMEYKELDLSEFWPLPF